MWPQQWGNDVVSDRSLWHSFAQVAWDASLWHSYRGSVRSCQRINFFRTKDKEVPLNTPGNFGTTQHQDLGLVTVGVKGLGGGLAMHPRGSEFVYDMNDWRSVEQFMNESTDVVTFGGIQLESATQEYYHATVHGTLAPPNSSAAGRPPSAIQVCARSSFFNP